ncbi:MAG: inosamine-phosphate amidinotransferase 1 [Ignavibacteriae bacterium]|nr:inosamine-phosphate amidinotransferase 1 [Ignavibacteria bacterium]MBI3365264.1 inosamine-phosphate amidinotransferase 1 [Ignavibacteriota bacterium]
MITRTAVNSYDEWTQLFEVIVGNIDGFTGFHLDNSFDLFYWDNIRPFLASRNFFRNNGSECSWPRIEIEVNIINELKEDIENFVEALKASDVRVRRPSIIVGSDRVQTPYWESFQSPPLNIRDQTLILGSAIIETSPHVRARLFENDYLKPLFLEYMQGGARWISMPRPTLSAGALDTSSITRNSEEQFALRDHHAVSLPNLGMELVFDGAQCIRLGEDIMVNVSNKNHELGFQWLQSNFGDNFNFHRLDRLADNHVDSMILPLRAGLWLVRGRKVLDSIPEKFRKWDFIIAPETKRDMFPSYEGKNLSIASKFIDMNILSINENTVIVNSLYPEMIKELESHGFNVVPVRHRHRRLFGGGFHCFTLDVCRSGKLQSYA